MIWHLQLHDLNSGCSSGSSGEVPRTLSQPLGAACPKPCQWSWPWMSQMHTDGYSEQGNGSALGLWLCSPQCESPRGGAMSRALGSDGSDSHLTSSACCVISGKWHFLFVFGFLLWRFCWGLDEFTCVKPVAFCLTHAELGMMDTKLWSWILLFVLSHWNSPCLQPGFLSMI